MLSRYLSIGSNPFQLEQKHESKVKRSGKKEEGRGQRSKLNISPPHESGQRKMGNGEGTQKKKEKARSGRNCVLPLFASDSLFRSVLTTDTIRTVREERVDRKGKKNIDQSAWPSPVNSTPVN